MDKSSHFSLWIEGFSSLQHCPEHGYPSAREGDESLRVMFPFGSLAVVECFGKRIFCGDRAESTLVEDALERLVPTIGAPPARTVPGLALDGCKASGASECVCRGEAPHVANCSEELCRQYRPHPWQRADEGVIRVACKQSFQIALNRTDLLARVKGFTCQFADQLSRWHLARNRDALCFGNLNSACCQGLASMQMRCFAQMRRNPGFSGAPDFGWRHVPGEQCKRTFAAKVKCLFKPGVNAAEQPSDAGDAAYVVLHQITASPHLQTQGDTGIIIGKDGPQITGAHKLGNGMGVAGIGLAFASGKALPSPVHGNTRRVNQGKSFGQKTCFDEARERANHINADYNISIQGVQVRNQGVDRIRIVLDRAVKNNPARFVNCNRPVNRFCRINSNTYLHLPTSRSLVARTPHRACIALHSHQGHRVISGHSGAATKAAQRPKPSTTATMTTIPSLPAHQQLRTIDSARKRGKAP